MYYIRHIGALCRVLHSILCVFHKINFSCIFARSIVSTFVPYLTCANRIVIMLFFSFVLLLFLWFGITYKQISYYSYNLLASVNFNACSQLTPLNNFTI